MLAGESTNEEELYWGFEKSRQLSQDENKNTFYQLWLDVG